MSKIKHWDERTQQWVIDGASNAANIELTNPGYLDENGNSISVDQGFTKIQNRIFQAEKNIAWIYQNGAKGGGGGGGGGTIDGTSYSIEIEEGNRVYTSSNSVTIHITITGGSVKKNFNVVIQDEQGNTKGNYVITSLTRSEIKINNLTNATNRLTINANSGQNYANPVTFTVIAGAIKLTALSTPSSTLYPQNPVSNTVINVANSTDSALDIIVLCNGTQLGEAINVAQAKEKQVTINTISQFLDDAKTTSIGETFNFEIYALGVLNDNVLCSESITFDCTIVTPGMLYILTYGAVKDVPANNIELDNLTRFVYGGSIEFDYELAYSSARYPTYNVYYTVSPCYFEAGQIVEDTTRSIEGTTLNVNKGLKVKFLCNTASLPDDTVYDPDTNQYKFVKVTLHAVSVDDTVSPERQDTKVLYFTLSQATTKYITATNFNSSLFAYFSPVMGVPVGNVTDWTYDTRNTRFTYNPYGVVQERYVNLHGYNLSGFMQQTDMQGIHLQGKGYVDLEINMFSENANEVNLLDGNGWTLSFTYRTDANVDDTDVVVSLGKYNGTTLQAGIEIQASKVIHAVQTSQSSLNTTKGDLTTVDIIGQRYVGPGDTQSRPSHWFIKVYLNGVLSLINSYTQDQIFNTDNGGVYGWYFNDFLHIGGRVVDGEVTDSCSVHVYDIKAYSTALSDNEIIQNYISSTIYSQLEPNANPDMSTQNEMLQKNFIQVGTDGNYHSLLFDDNDESEYKDATSLLSSLITALAESRIPYPIVVINQTTSDSNFLGVTESKFNEDLKNTVMSYRFPISMDYYTMGNTAPVRIQNNNGDNGMRIGIQGTSSLRYNSKNYEIYMGQNDEGKDVLVQMREDWMPENRYTLKADVMDSSHVNNILVGSIVNGLVTTEDNQGNTVHVVPLDNTPPMSKGGYQYASKIKHTSEGYPCILFINFRASGSSVSNCRCMGIYNFNLGRYAYFNLGLKLLNGVVYADQNEVYPRMVESYTEETEIETGSPVYSMEVQENSAIAMFDQDDPDILGEGVFEFPYDSDGRGYTNLQKLLTFLASFGRSVETDKKVYRQNEWQTPKLKKINGTWQQSGEYYSTYDNANYVQSTVDLHMNWNNMVSYYMIAIIFGLVDSMAKNLTLRSWTKSSSGDNIWYMCFYDMDTALRVNNVGAETVPYNAHLHRYYTDTSAIAEARVTNHCSSIPGVFNQEYSGYNTRLQEIVENCPVGSNDSKTLQSVYYNLRTNLFPDPEEFINNYYIGQINKVGAALYNYDYYLKYLQVEKTYNPATQQYGDNTYNYSEISYLHGNGNASVKDWFIKRIRFLDGVYGVGTDGYSTLIGVNNTPLAASWNDNNATYITNVSPTSVQLTLQAESQIRITIATAAQPSSFWIDNTPRDYRINNVGGTQVVTIYANQYLTQLGKFNQFTWYTISSLNFPMIKELSLRDQTNIRSEAFLENGTNLASLVKLDLHGVTLLDATSNIVYMPFNRAQQLPNLEELDISDSSFNEVPLSSSSVLRKLNLSNTRIKALNYSNQAMLEELDITGCAELETINLNNCPKLKSLTVPASVRTVHITNCPGIESIFADYNGSQLYISKLTELVVSACPGLKYVSLNNQNNQELEVSLVGAPNLENVQLSRIVILADKIEFPAKSNWNTLKEINLSSSYISYINYANTTPLVTTYLDLQHFQNLEYINLSENRNIRGVKCHNVQDRPINLQGSCMSGCSGMQFLYGNFKITGTRVFLDCASLTLNSSRIYSSYPVLQYPVPFINDSEACNIAFSPELASTDEMFNGCSSLSGSDFNMLMLQLHDGITSLNKMFMNCASVDAEIAYDLFRHCPNVTNITSFAESTSLCGGIYSRSSNYSSEDSTTWGTFDFLSNLQQVSNAFSGSGIQYIDDNVFAPLDGVYKGLMEADYMFSNCYDLESCQLVNRNNIVRNGYLHSKTFFTNLRNLGTFPKGFFSGCSKVNMQIDSEVIGEITYDYLYHWPYSINIRTVDSSIYQGVNLIGEIHDNVFGGRLESDGEYSIVKFTVINAPFEGSGGNIRCNFSQMGRMFENLASTILQAKYVFRGVTFTNSAIPNNIFAGCTKLNNLQGFFSNPTLTNEGNSYTFPVQELFQDCTSLANVSYLFDSCYNLDIELVGRGFRNCALTDVSNMMHCSAVYGMIPYQLFYMERSGIIQQSIDNITGVFSGCYKLGYTRNRKIDIGTTYENNRIEYVTQWTDGVIKVQGTRVPFQLDFTNFDGNDPWYIDGRDWKTINPALQSSSYYNTLYTQVFQYDEQQVQALSDPRDREVGYQNYMFPADYLRYCSAQCTMEGAFSGLTYYPKTLGTNDEGVNFLIVSDTTDGLVGRLPCKLFEANTQNTKLEGVFTSLGFCAFINFNSYKLNTGYQASQCRGIKYPPDLLVHNTNLLSISGMFQDTFIETGVDINQGLLDNNTALTDVSALFKDVLFSELDYEDAPEGNYAQIPFDIFANCSELQNVSRLFEVTNRQDYERGLRIIQSILFDPDGAGDADNPRITNIQSMFANNQRLTGSIPLFSVANFPRIRTVSGYVEGVNKGSITNANSFISMHDTSWIPQSWIENNG